MRIWRKSIQWQLISSMGAALLASILVVVIIFTVALNRLTERYLVDTALPASIEQVQALVRACRAHHVALVARGAGTGTTGAAVPLPPAGTKIRALCSSAAARRSRSLPTLKSI